MTGCSHQTRCLDQDYSVVLELDQYRVTAVHCTANINEGDFYLAFPFDTTGQGESGPQQANGSDGSVQVNKTGSGKLIGLGKVKILSLL